MLAIRMQRTGRKGHAMFRMVVQDSRRTPTSGKVVAQLGSYDPHAKTVTLDKVKAAFYLEHGAQPSDRTALLLKREGVKLPDWVNLPAKREGVVRHADKRRSTRPPEPVEEAKPEAVEEPAAEVDEPETTDAPAVEEAPVVEEVTPEAETTEEAAAEPETEPAADEVPAEDAKEA